MSESPTAYQDSIWGEQDVQRGGPRRCPHCDEELAHPDRLRENDDVAVSEYTEAYRQHRRAHFAWGRDPAADTDGDGDPYLADYYGDGDDSHLPDDEEVAGVYNVEIRYEATMHATVVAPTEYAAKDRAKELRGTGEDLSGYVPEPEVTMEVHDDVTEQRQLTRGEIKESSDVDESESDQINYAERLPGWPW